MKKFNLTFPLLSDEGNRIASKFGLVFRLPDDLQELYIKFGADLERFNGDNSWTLPMPGRFIVDPQGIIQRVDVDPDYTLRPEPADILEIIKRYC